MSQKMKKTLIGATLLATAPTVKAAGTGGGVTEGGKSQRGVNHLTLEEAPRENITLCVPGKSMTGLTGDFRYLPDKVAVVINPFERNYVKLTFVVSHVNALPEDHVLFLAYSQQISPSPQIITPRSLQKLQLDLSSLEIVGIYNVPAFGMEAQPETRIGSGNPAPRVKWEFDINLDTTEIPSMMNNQVDTIYMQAALISKRDFDSEKWDAMILSELDTVQFVANECPDTMVVEEGQAAKKITEMCANEEGMFGSCSNGQTNTVK